MGFNEKTHAYIAAKYYHYLTEAFGERGLNAFIHATRYYGMQRGRRMAQRAIRQGEDLTQSAYNYYGEWVPTEDKREEGCESRSEMTPEGSLKNTRCPCYLQFPDMGRLEAGREYCKHLDRAISDGFNPDLNYIVDQTLHTGDCCIHRLARGNIGEGSERGRYPEGLRSFEYHCAHSFWAYREVAAAVFRSEGEKVSDMVLRDFAEDYGQDMADRILEYRDTNFNICD